MYKQIIQEQLLKIGDETTNKLFLDHCKMHIDPFISSEEPIPSMLKNTHRPSYKDSVGTGKGFGHYLTNCINVPKNQHHEKLCIVDIDLATSCGINGAVHNDSYYELGVSEQDAISFAAGKFYIVYLIFIGQLIACVSRTILIQGLRCPEKFQLFVPTRIF